MDRPKVSVVTLSFNQAAFLEEAMESVLGQDYPAIEYIVVDPGSTDGSRDTIARYKDRLAAVVLEPDEGPADGLNKGLAVATGEYFAYLNSDDAFLPGALQGAVQAFQAAPSADVVYGNGWFVDATGTPLRKFLSDRFAPQDYVRGASVVMQQATVLKTEAVRKVGGFVHHNRTCWDGELLLDIAMAGGSLRRVWRDWGLFRLHGDAISAGHRTSTAYGDDKARMFEKYYGRRPNRRDLALGKVARLKKYIADPRRTAGRLLGGGALPQGRATS